MTGQAEPTTFDRRATDAVAVKLEMLHDDVNDMKGVLKELTVAINRLAVVEERQTQTATALERAFVALERVEHRLADLEKNVVTSTKLEATEKRLGELEKQGVKTNQTNDWVGKAVWALVAAAAVFVGKKVGLL